MESEVPPARVPAMDRRRLLTAGAAGTVGAGADAIGPDGDICGNPLVEGQSAVAANCRRYIAAATA